MSAGHIGNALAATAGALFAAKPGQQPRNVVPIAEQPTPAPSAPTVAEPAEVTAAQPARAPRAKGKGTVAATTKRIMLYMTPKAAKKIREIASHDERKVNDIYTEAVREYLEKRGHTGLL